MKFGVRRTVLIGPASRVTLLSIVALSLFLGGPSPCAFGDEVIAAHGPYAEVARRLKPWISSEMETKGLPAISHRSRRRPAHCLGSRVWVRGPGASCSGDGRNRLSGRLDFQAIHRDGGDATRRSRKARSRRTGQSLPPRVFTAVLS